VERENIDAGVNDADPYATAVTTTTPSTISVASQRTPVVTWVRYTTYETTPVAIAATSTGAAS
jgi:hypothetical protein